MPLADLNDDPRLVSAIGVATTYGVVHAVLDAPCAALLLHQAASATLSIDAFWTLFIVYHCLAFGLQFSIGAAVDRWRHHQLAVQAGLGSLCLAVTVFLDVPWVAAVLAGVGNALFHVGAGAVVLRLYSRATLPAGIFVAPGVVGLALGGLCAKWVPHWNWLLLGLLLASMVVVHWLDGRTENEPAPRPACPVFPIRIVWIAVCAMGLSVVIRTAVALLIGRMHDGEPYVLFSLAVAACVGNVLGGFFADRLGWITTGVGALLLSAPLLSFFAGGDLPAIAGMVLFQMTMPVTLLAIYRVFPEEPGLAFGVPSLAILLGALPVYLFPLGLFSSAAAILSLILFSAVVLLFGLGKCDWCR